MFSNKEKEILNYFIDKKEKKATSYNKKGAMVRMSIHGSLIFNLIWDYFFSKEFISNLNDNYLIKSNQLNNKKPPKSSNNQHICSLIFNLNLETLSDKSKRNIYPFLIDKYGENQLKTLLLKYIDVTLNKVANKKTLLEWKTFYSKKNSN